MKEQWRLNLLLTPIPDPVTASSLYRNGHTTDSDDNHRNSLRPYYPNPQENGH